MNDLDLYLVRHGSTASTNHHVVFGQEEIELSDEGRAQVRRLADDIAEEEIEKIFTSPLRRAHECADILSAGTVPVITDDRLKEINFGSCSGQEVSGFPEIFFDKYQSRLTVTTPFPQGESLEDLRRRIDDFNEYLLDQKLSSAVVVSHQWFLNHYLKSLLDLKFGTGSDFIFKPGKVTYIKLSQDGADVIAHNIDSFKILIDIVQSKHLDPEKVRLEFDKRAREREGINKVLSARFDQSVNEKFNNDVQQLLDKHFGGQSLSNALEIGVGIGRLGQYFSQISNRYVGVDFSPEMLANASKQLKERRNVELILSDGNSINFLPLYFDLGIVSLVLKHNNDVRAEELIEKMKGWCRRILLIEHVAGGAGGSEIAVVRPEEWYLEKFAPKKPVVVERFKRANDNILFAIFE